LSAPLARPIATPDQPREAGRAFAFPPIGPGRQALLRRWAQRSCTDCEGAPLAMERLFRL
jgi:hypothetical protein